MKTNIIFALIFLVTLNVFSQHKDRERIKAQKIAFITNRLDLSSEEAQKFWPVYNAFDEKTTKIRHEEIRSIRKQSRENIETLSEEEAKILLEKMMASESELHKLNTNFINDIKNILPAKKIISLKIAEKDFHRKLLEQFKKKQPQHRP